jgi:hypothetical protein
MQHGMTQLGILFPKGADDHARFILPKEVERVLDHRGSTCTPPSISTGVKGEGWILVFHVLDIKGFVVEPVLAQPHLSPGSTQKSNECICHDFESKKGKDFFCTKHNIQYVLHKINLYPMFAVHIREYRHAKIKTLYKMK